MTKILVCSPLSNTQVPGRGITPYLPTHKMIYKVSMYPINEFYVFAFNNDSASF